MFIGVCFAGSINVGCMKGSKSSIKCFILIQLLGFVQSCKTVHSRDVCVPFLFLQTVTRQLFTDCFKLTFDPAREIFLLWNYTRADASKEPVGAEVNDEELIDRTLAGDKSAFGTLAERYQDRVYKQVLPIVGDENDAMDVTQETFLQALSHLDSFRRSSRFYTWLYRIAYNCAVGWLRRRRRTVSIDTVTEDYGETFVSKVDAPDRAQLPPTTSVFFEKL